MVQLHHRPGILIRWFHRCPECRQWFGLKMLKTSRNISGVHRDFECRHCGVKIQDWKPYESVKF